MKQNNRPRTKNPIRGLTLGCVVAAVVAGCGVTETERMARNEITQELEKLQQENRELQKLRVENQELPRLRRENQEIQSLRGQELELARLRQENERLRKETAAKSSKSASASLGNAPDPGQLSIVQQGNIAPGTSQPDGKGAPPDDPNIPKLGDQILVEPRLLSNLLPGFDWSKIDRKEPIVINGLLEQQGIVLTNYQQLLAFGVTNYVVQHGPPPKPEDGGEK